MVAHVLAPVMMLLDVDVTIVDTNIILAAGPAGAEVDEVDNEVPTGQGNGVALGNHDAVGNEIAFDSDDSVDGDDDNDE